MPYKEVYGRNNSESLKDCDQKNSTVKIKQNNNNIRCSKIQKNLNRLNYLEQRLSGVL